MTFDEQAATLDRKSIVGLLASHQQLTERNAELKRQLDWLKTQLFGTTSERRVVDPDGRQLSLSANGGKKMLRAPRSRLRSTVVVVDRSRGRIQTKASCVSTNPCRSKRFASLILETRRRSRDHRREGNLSAGAAVSLLRRAEVHPRPW